MAMLALSSTHSHGEFQAGHVSKEATEIRERTLGRELALHGGQGPVFEGSSHYHDSYPAHVIQRTAPVLPVCGKHTGGVFSGQSTQNADYVAHHIVAKQIHRPGPFRPSDAPFCGETAYKSDYPAYVIDPALNSRAVGRPAQTHIKSVFEGQSAYKEAYTAHMVEPRQPFIPHPMPPSTATFQGQSHYKSEFIVHEGDGRSPSAAPARPPYVPLKFEGQTHNQEMYKAHPVEPRVQHAHPAYQPSDIKFATETESNQAYKAYPIDPNASHRSGPAPPMRASVPFEGGSTSKADFQGWQLPAHRPALGVHLVGDKAHILIPADATLPAIGKQVFTTVHNNQQELSVVVLSGDSNHSLKNAVLGHFDLVNLPPGPKGSARIEVAFHLDRNNLLTATALDLDNARQEEWLHHGAMFARTPDIPVV